MAERPLHILQVNQADIQGGAAKVAWELCHAYRARGHNSWLAVGLKLSDDPGVLPIQNDQYRNRWARICLGAGDALSPLIGRVRGAGRLRRWLHTWIGQPWRWLAMRLGHEDFDFPGSWRLLDLPTERPDILHCHNLHGGYFDLRLLPRLSQQVPVVLTLHDAWMLGGHCAHSLDCERWKTGCGQCPDLTLRPTIRRDATACNWRRKQAIYTETMFYVATPSRWLMNEVEQSILSTAVVEARVIPNGVDLSVFQPVDKRWARDALGLAQNVRILLFAANGIRRNIWKDYQTLRAAVARTANRLDDQVVFVALGEDAAAERIGQAEVRFVAYQRDPQTVARYYQAADVYVHAARVENFPNTIVEALACGTPVVATGVGGIPEQIQEGVTGFLVPSGNSELMSDRVAQLLTSEGLRRQMGAQGADSARRYLGLDRQAQRYLAWYEGILETWQTNCYPEPF